MYWLAQVNIGRMLAPLSDPVMAGFVAKLDEINTLADNSEGFIWRLQTPEGNATSLRHFEDELILVNLSVWTDLATYANFVYKSQHRQLIQQRRQWFQKFEGPYTAIWWIPREHTPDVKEAKERLEHLRIHGETPYAFTFKKTFPAPAESDNISSPLIVKG
ncbi:DUF3291 domain-containing protein [Ktedonosporobacter rubrisoli]|uniref:DUF3291 domain-containing protein n=2 Tax=Ktedonosporobacter rubrisoli TaxID=2509675 RepID=A0A4P6K5I2_KTERU|nr:DUF3291 domain-containing protein [Ktedonosporobacter rubrisoli]